jgi:hypothetical protein
MEDILNCSVPTLVLPLLAVLSLAPAVAIAQQTVEYQEPLAQRRGPDRVRGALYAGAHFGGQALQSTPAGDTSVSLGPAPTVGVRLEIPLGQALALGGFLDYASVQSRDAPRGAERLALVGAGLWLKLRMLLELQLSLIELYAGVPIGVSVWVPTSPGFDPQVGLALGFVGGAQAHITDAVALFLEAGFRFDYFSVSGVETSYFQGSLHAGVSFGL